MYSFSNKRDRTQLAVGVSKPYTYILGGEGFKYFVKEGQKVNAGDKLLQFDSEKIKAHGYETTCIFVVTNGDEYPDMKLHTGMDAVQGETVIAEF